jgi:hypothetical protein
MAADFRSVALVRLTAVLAGVCVAGTMAVTRAATDRQAEQQADQKADQKVAQKGGDDKRPSLALKATPPLGFSPLRVHASVDVRGGPDDSPDFYCPAVSWDWGDGTVSENSEDCDPYEEGTSAIRRRFSANHTFQQGGAYRVTFRLKQKTRVIASASTNVQVRAGVRDEFGR